MSAYHAHLLRLAQRYADADMAVPIDLEAELSAEGLSLELLHSCKDTDTDE